MPTDRTGYRHANTRSIGFRRPKAQAIDRASNVEASTCSTTTSVAEGSARTAVIPAVSLAVSPANSREKPTTETQGSQSSSQSGCKSETTKPNCYACIHRAGLVGDAHSMCSHPRITDEDRAITPVMIMTGLVAPAQKRLNVYGHAHGIRSGWFMWPLNFDPTWLVSCDGFQSEK